MHIEEFDCLEVLLSSLSPGTTETRFSYCPSGCFVREGWFGRRERNGYGPVDGSKNEFAEIPEAFPASVDSLGPASSVFDVSPEFMPRPYLSGRLQQLSSNPRPLRNRCFLKEKQINKDERLHSPIKPEIIRRKRYALVENNKKERKNHDYLSELSLHMT